VAGPDPLSLLGAGSGLSIDREGRLCHGGEPITHARTLSVLWGSLARLPDGRYQVQVGREQAFVQVLDAPFGVASLREGPGGLLLRLTSGAEQPLDPVTLRLGADGVLRCTLAGGHRARFGRAAQAAVAPMLEESAPGRYALRIGPRAWPIGLE
jgi:uncharacterized protein